MKIVILGSSGIVAQHMRLCVPADVTPIWCRKTKDILHRGLDLTDDAARVAFMESERPDVVINLAGESRPDVVEKNPEAYQRLNAEVPGLLAARCDAMGCHFIQVSTQAVFSGLKAPYGADSECGPVNLYGCQKHEAESRVKRSGNHWTIVRLTFVLGVRPMLAYGRQNPIEQMIASSGMPVPQVNDRHFSVLFADEAAQELWSIARLPRMDHRRIIHLGSGHFNRFQLAERVNPSRSTAVRHDSFPGIAPRPHDTTYSNPHDPGRFGSGLARCVDAYRSREAIGHTWNEDRTIPSEIQQRVREISIFTGFDEHMCATRLKLGFGALHKAVADDFRRANPESDEELLNWYRKTDTYNWELSAYHADPGFSYGKMTQGIAEALKARGAQTVLCLGDGIGDLTLSLTRAGFHAVYHDLFDSVTAKFALARFAMYLPKMPPYWLTQDWNPALLRGAFDAVVSLDFLEHVTDVPAWTDAIKAALKPGGFLVSQNAFACGSGPDGSIPMHLARNDRFERDWDPMLAEMGFIQESSNWYRRAA